MSDWDYLFCQIPFRNHTKQYEGDPLTFGSPSYHLTVIIKDRTISSGNTCF